MSEATFVLVRPSRPSNVAAACRALKNMGMRSLRLVSPPPDLHEETHRALAYGAWDVLDGARTCASLAEAVADTHLVVGTSGRASAEAVAPRALAEIVSGRPSDRVALVFGPEASGLRNDELALCHLTVRIPSDPECPSLNLAQAVLVVAYELRVAALARASASPETTTPEPAAVGEVEAALRDLQRVLLAIGYLNAADPDGLVGEGRALLSRARATPREVTLLRGLARQIAWAARIAEPGAGEA
jgi:tRNA (cytidine32/uridine32-2'-O)-methyltransferase